MGWDRFDDYWCTLHWLLSSFRWVSLHGAQFKRLDYCNDLCRTLPFISLPVPKEFYCFLPASHLPICICPATSTFQKRATFLMTYLLRRISMWTRRLLHSVQLSPSIIVAWSCHAITAAVDVDEWTRNQGCVQGPFGAVRAFMFQKTQHLGNKVVSLMKYRWDGPHYLGWITEGHWQQTTITHPWPCS